MRKRRTLADDVASPESSGEEAIERAITPTKQPRRRQTTPASTRVVVDSETTRGAGAAGVGGGTLIAVIASSLPDGIYKSVLIWLAPTATVTFTALWIWGRKKVVSHYESKEADREFASAREAIERALANPNLTPVQKADFEAKRVELDLMIVERSMAKATAHARRK